jgi:parallel beta-helix repeat protein
MKNLLHFVILIISIASLLLAGFSLSQGQNVKEYDVLIGIYGNSSFQSSELVSGGSGTSEDPWIIENIVIDKPSPIGFWIQDTTDHLIIRNCDISGTNISGQIFGGNSGIMLENVRNAVITSNRFHNNTHGIQIYDCSNVILENNQFENNNQYGVVISGESSYVSIDSNNMTNNGWGGVKVSFSNSCTIKNCVMENNTDGYGIFVENSKLNKFSGNTIRSNLYGIFLRESNENSIFGNEINSNENGLHLQGCQDNIIYHTNFMNNTHPAFDDLQNQWYNTSLKSGNYWDNHTEIDSYSIQGGSNTDSYPLAEPIQIYSEESQNNWQFTNTIIITVVILFICVILIFYIVRKARKKNVRRNESDQNATIKEEPHDP